MDHPRFAVTEQTDESILGVRLCFTNSQAVSFAADLVVESGTTKDRAEIENELEENSIFIDGEYDDEKAWKEAVKKAEDAVTNAAKTMNEVY